MSNHAATLAEFVQGLQTTAASDKAETAAAQDLAVLPPPLPIAQAHYSHEAMVDLMVLNPQYTHAQFAAHFGRHPSWTSAVLASDAFQQALDLRRHEVLDPSLTATMEERFRALALRSVTVLQEKLNTTGVSDLVVLKAAEIGIKALGMGNAPPPLLPTLPSSSSETVADRLLAAMDRRDQQRTIPGNVTVVSENDDD